MTGQVISVEHINAAHIIKAQNSLTAYFKVQINFHKHLSEYHPVFEVRHCRSGPNGALTAPNELCFHLHHFCLCCWTTVTNVPLHLTEFCPL